MLTDPNSTARFNQLPELKNITDEVGVEVLKTAKLITVPKGTVLFQPGDVCQQYVLTCKGSIKVQQTSIDGREIVLYRVQDGESCVLTTTSLMTHEKYSATGIAETDVDALVIPAKQFHEGLNKSQGLRQFVFDNYSLRLGELIQLVRSLAFDPLENRLATKLIEMADEKNRVNRTHQSLATDLGCTREVISRRLKEFEHLGWVYLHRGHIEIVSIQALKNIAS